MEKFGGFIKAVRDGWNEDGEDGSGVVHGKMSREVSMDFVGEFSHKVRLKAILGVFGGIFLDFGSV